jgi:hypothetical protein
MQAVTVPRHNYSATIHGGMHAPQPILEGCRNSRLKR